MENSWMNDESLKEIDSYKLEFLQAPGIWWNLIESMERDEVTLP